MSTHLPVPIPAARLPLPAPSGDRGPEAPPAAEFDWRTYATAVMRYKWMVAAIALAGTAGGVAVALIVPPTYQAEATIWIESARRAPGDPGPIWAAQLLGQSGWMELARSEAVLRHVVFEQRLYTRAGSRNAAAALATMERSGEDLRSGTYRLEVVDRAAQVYGLRDEHGDLVDRAAFGEPVGAPIGVRWIPPQPVDRPVEFELLAPYDATRELADRLRIRSDRDGSFMRLQLRGDNPTRLAAVVNSVADRFVDVAADLKRQRLTALVGILGGQLDVARQNLDGREESLKAFRARSATMLTRGGAPVVAGVGVSRDPMFAAYLDSRVTHDQLQADRQAIERALRPGPDGRPSIAALELVGSVQRSTALMQALRDLTDKSADLRSLRSRYTDEHPLVRRLADEVAGLERQTIPDLARAVVAELATREAVVAERAESTSLCLRRLSPLAVEEASLEREVAVAEQLYTGLQQRYEEARLSEVSTIPDVRVLDQARAPRRPQTHMAPLMVLLGMLGGAGVGVGSAVVRQLLDRKVRLPHEVTTDLGIRVLGVVPRVDRTGGTDATDPAVEALRVIRLNLVHAYGAAGPIVFSDTSAGGSAGKSSVACTRALSFAGAGHRTLLSDADTRRGGLHRVLNAARKPGLIDHLTGHVPADGVVQRTTHTGLDFIGCGARARSLVSPFPRNRRRRHLRRSIPACSGGPHQHAAQIQAPLPLLFPSFRPDPPLAAPGAHPRPLPMARVSRVASPPTPAWQRRLCSALFDAHRKSHGQFRLMDGAPAPDGCGADARGG
jgi:uncharacterized protein involved in exopolysaccharide biosynthesis